jgi:hypothetical protein
MNDGTERGVLGDWAYARENHTDSPTSLSSTGVSDLPSRL